MEEFYLDSCGAGRLHCALWKPEGEPKAVVQLIHGIAEHILRYDHFATFLTQHGYLVVAEDHMGHGGTLARGDVQGYFDGGWLCAVEKSVMMTGFPSSCASRTATHLPS